MRRLLGIGVAVLTLTVIGYFSGAAIADALGNVLLVPMPEDEMGFVSYASTSLDRERVGIVLAAGVFLLGAGVWVALAIAVIAIRCMRLLSQRNSDAVR